MTHMTYPDNNLYRVKIMGNLSSLMIQDKKIKIKDHIPSNQQIVQLL